MPGKCTVPKGAHYKRGEWRLGALKEAKSSILREKNKERKKETMASFSSSILMPPASFTSKTLELGYASSSSLSCRCSLILTPLFIPQRKQMMFHKNRSKLKQRVLSMAPEEEKLTRRNPLDFPIVTLSLSVLPFSFLCIY